jgi:predicted kinase
MVDGAEGAAAASVILIGGPPAAGKTTVGRRIAQELGLPFVHRDGIKETLFDSLGWRDRTWSQKLGGASWDLLFYFAKLLLASGQSFVLESNFDPVRHAPIVRECKRATHLLLRRCSVKPIPSCSTSDSTSGPRPASATSVTWIT